MNQETTESLSTSGIGIVKDIMGLEDVDHTQFHDMKEYNNTPILLHIRDDGESDLPSIRYGVWLPVTVVAFVFVFAVVLVAVLIYCSKQQYEKAKIKQEEKDTEQKICHRRNILECRRWSQDKTDDTSSSSKEESFSDYSSADLESSEEHGDCCCKLCQEPFQIGQPVYESNNPQCQHTFHMECMDKWLNLQNTCPVCNQFYVLQQLPV